MRNDPMAVYLFDWLRQLVATNEGKVLYILALICVAMIVDFLVGSLAACVLTENADASIKPAIKVENFLFIIKNLILKLRFKK